MISHISIKNFATIENVEVDFHKGLNIMTGETGSGKSIVIEAISIALGGRADSTFVRSGKDKATIQIVAEHENRDVILTREISSAGKNLCKIDGEIVSLAQLNSLCRKIADIHGQYDHQSLLNPANHIKLVDLYQHESINPIRKRIADLYSDYKDALGRLEKLDNDSKENQRRKEFMAYEIDEIEKAHLIPGEDDELAEQITVLQNIEKIYEALENSYEITQSGSYSITESMNKVLNLLKEISSHSREISDLEGEFSDIYYRFEDMSTRIRIIKDKIVFMPDELNQYIQRQEVIESFKRKYGGTIDEILNYKDDLEKKLSSIENMDQDKESLAIEVKRYEEMLKSECDRLTSLRKSSAGTLNEKIQKELEDLNFSDVTLFMDFKRTADYTDDGVDKIEFLISTNKGEALKPLAKIASGGEMSRIMLAFKKIIGEYDGIPTMIFDEIDSGISGSTASIVGKKFTEIAQNHQLICITHLPQIAAYGDHNYKIDKVSDDKATFTSITHLSDKEKIDEIGRLLGGIDITDSALRNAVELIAHSE